MEGDWLPYGAQDVNESDIAAVIAALRSDFLTTGPRVESFERAFARKTGARHAVALSNATAALHLAALAGGMGPGEIGLAPTMSFLASANGMRYTGADVLFVDCDPETGLITPHTFLRAIEAAPKIPRMAVIVHLNGNICDLPSIGRIAYDRNILLIEDACHAIGGSYLDECGTSVMIGSCRHSAMACFSFHPVKTITMGEGGVVTTNDDKLDRNLRMLRSHGMTREVSELSNVVMAVDEDGAINPWYYEMSILGYNYRATDFQCALGESQLARLEHFAARRADIKQRYDNLFAECAVAAKPIATPPRTAPVLHLYALRIAFGQSKLSRGALMHALRKRGIGTQVHYIPIHKQPYYAALGRNQFLPGADSYYSSILSIPFFPRMNDADIDRVVEAFAELIPGDASGA
jgi:UDP-4-amino-4,6-dideoxy-N-acetyl-beta-L-altrosamine transaminase